MKTKIKKEQLIAGILTLLFIASLITTLLVFNSNLSLKSGLNDQKLVSESLLSEKLALEKEIMKIKNEMSSLKGKNVELDHIIAGMSQQLSEKERHIAMLNREMVTVKDLTRQVKDLLQLRSDLEKQVTFIKESNDKLLAENEILHKTIFDLELENAELAQDMQWLQNNNADNFQVVTTKGKKNNSLTIKASKASKISVDFDVPMEFANGISFTIITPDGKKITDANKSLSWKYGDNSRVLTADLNGAIGDVEVTRSVTMTYSPGEKLVKGTYQIEVLNNGRHIGSCRMRLK